MPYLMFLLATPAAQDWVRADAPSLGTGGASVVGAEGPVAAYWNPATMGLPSEEGWLPLVGGTGFAASIFTEAALAGGVAEDIGDLIELLQQNDIEALMNKLNTGAASDTDIQDALRIVQGVQSIDEHGEGVLTQAGGAFEFKLGQLSLSHRQFAFGALDPAVSFSNLSALADGGFGELFNTTGTGDAPATPAGIALRDRLLAAGISAADANELAWQAEQALGAGVGSDATQTALVQVAQATQAGAANPDETFLNNPSGVTARGMRWIETAVGFGLSLSPLVSVGGALKHVRVETFVERFTVREMPDLDSGVIRDTLTRSQRSEDHIDVDVAGIVHLSETVSAGLVIRNLWPIRVRFDGGDDFTVGPNLRAGAAVSLGVARAFLDLDLTDNPSAVLAGYHARRAAIGAELTLPFRLRVGLEDNLAFAKDSPVFTAGIGLHLGPFFFDLSGMTALRWGKVELEDDTIRVPERFAVALTIGVDVP